MGEIKDEVYIELPRMMTELKTKTHQTIQNVDQ